MEESLETKAECEDPSTKKAPPASATMDESVATKVECEDPSTKKAPPASATMEESVATKLECEEPSKKKAPPASATMEELAETKIQYDKASKQRAISGQREEPSTLSLAPSHASIASTPGAFRIEGYASRERSSVNTGDSILRSDSLTNDSDLEAPVLEAEVSQCTGTIGSTSNSTPNTIDADITNAYLVEETTVQGEATIVESWCGIEKKYLVVIAILVIVTIVAAVLGSIIGRNDSNAEPFPSCGPLCGSEDQVPDPERIVLGRSCEDWSLASLLPETNTTSLDEEGSSCESQFSAAAYGCGCPNIQLPSNTCGSLCSSGAALPDPDKVVQDVHGTVFTCREWELLSQFDTESNDFCFKYNAVGFLCGCEDNIPPPDSCGSLCADNTLPRPSVIVWGESCEYWNTMSTFLPAMYGDNGESETCSQMFQDIAYRCECPGVEPPPDECNVLCQARSFCGASMCQDNSPILYPDKVVRGLACKDWSFFSRLTDHPEMCYYYEMIGAECGCNNVPPSNACGPLCGADQVPHPSREIRGQTCSDWNYASTFLFSGYGEAMGAKTMISPTCDDFFSPMAYGCGCPSAEPPEAGCGFLCGDGLRVPDPEKIVGDLTCGDFELRALFETDPDTCYRYKTNIAKQCGCFESSPEEEFWSVLPCFLPEALDDKMFYFFAGMSQYSVSFGEGGTFLQIQSQDFYITVGKFSSIEATNTSTTTTIDDGDATGVSETEIQYQVSYGGGDRCGQYGPRRGSVVLVEDESLVTPEIISVIEPSICVYRATLAVPKFCPSN